MKNLILKDWGWIRTARLLFALYMIYKAYITNDYIYYIIGGLLMYQAILNIKCITGTCHSGSCSIDNSCTIPKTLNKDDNK